MEVTLEDWISCLSIPREEFSGMPVCPYSHRAIISIFCVADCAALEAVLHAMKRIPDRGVSIIEIEDPSGCSEVISNLRQQMVDKDLIVLPSDPDNPFIIGGFRTSYDKFLAIVQNRSELMRKSEQLKSTLYYSHWTEEQKKWLEDRF